MKELLLLLLNISIALLLPFELGKLVMQRYVRLAAELGVNVQHLFMVSVASLVIGTLFVCLGNTAGVIGFWLCEVLAMALAVDWLNRHRKMLGEGGESEGGSGESEGGGSSL